MLYLILVLLISINQSTFAEPVENDFGIVDGWYNGKEATVENIQLEIGETAEITVSVNSKIDCNVYVKLINPLVTVPYDVVSGPSDLDESIDNRGVKSGWITNYTWIIKPNGEWTNGNAPINIFVQFSDRGDDRIVKFTIANPYILNEQYSGPTPTHTPTDPSSTDQPPGSNGLPGFGVVGMMIALTLVLCSKRWLF
ncbi:MAG: sarcinarray family MAST domain-containing protein [Methanosarcinales archaeon]|nr:sarcinarray family MAST domain-containing protein [Methanosarcinales archaeon]